MKIHRFEFKDEVAQATILFVDIHPEYQPQMFMQTSVDTKGLPPDHPLVQWYVKAVEMLHEPDRGLDVIAVSPGGVEEYLISG